MAFGLDPNLKRLQETTEVVTPASVGFSTDEAFSLDANGNIRYIGLPEGKFTVLELHRWLQDKADDMDPMALLSMYDSTPSIRATDQVITLLDNHNIDNEVARHLMEGSITQDNGDTVYSGIVVVGPSDPNEVGDVWIESGYQKIHVPIQTEDPLKPNQIANALIRTRENGVDRSIVTVSSRTSQPFHMPKVGEGSSFAALFPK